MFLVKRSSINGIKEKIRFLLLLNGLFIKSIIWRDTNKVVVANMLSFKVYAYGYKALLFLIKEIFLTNDYKYITQKKDPIIFDCGANIGISVIYFKWLYPNARIVAFEPNLEAFNLLRKNVKENLFENVTIHNCALGIENGEINFYIDDFKGSPVASTNKDRGGGNSKMVKCCRLSDFLVESVDFLKMDIEGGEKIVIEELLQSDSLTKIKEAVLEYHHMIAHEKSNMGAFLKCFEVRGFDYNISGKYKEIGSFQDLIIRLIQRVQNK